MSETYPAKNFAAEATDDDRDEDGEIMYAFARTREWPSGSLIDGGTPEAIEADNTQRAAWGLAACEAFVDETFGGDADAESLGLVMGDLLADLMHLADAFGLDFDALIEKARFNYEPETEGVL